MALSGLTLKIKIKKAPSPKPQAPSFKPPKAAATLCHIDTRCSGATIWPLTMVPVSYIIGDMNNKKEKQHG